MKVATSCLTSNVWSNIKNGSIMIKNGSIMSHMVVSKDCCLFLEFVSTRQQGHEHQFLARDISHIICQYIGTSTTFAGIVTDNTSTNKKVWKLLQERSEERRVGKEC